MLNKYWLTLKAGRKQRHFSRANLLSAVNRKVCARSAVSKGFQALICCQGSRVVLFFPFQEKNQICSVKVQRHGGKPLLLHSGNHHTLSQQRSTKTTSPNTRRKLHHTVTVLPGAFVFCSFSPGFRLKCLSSLGNFKSRYHRNRKQFLRWGKGSWPPCQGCRPCHFGF